MRTVGNAVARTVKQASRRKREIEGVETPQERGHRVTRLGDARAAQRAVEARQLLELAKKFGIDEQRLTLLNDAARAYVQSEELWIFVMLSAQDNFEVVCWINDHSRRPFQAHALWAKLLTKLRFDSGEVTATRMELARSVGIPGTSVSTIMSELATINAVRTERDGSRVRYFVNPWICTHLATPAARQEARDGAGPVLVRSNGVAAE